jgi:hypothetical protein
MTVSLPPSRQSTIHRRSKRWTHRQLLEIEHFFKSYNEAEGRQFKVLSRRGCTDATKLVKSAFNDLGFAE